MEDLTLYEIITAVQGSYGYPSTEIVSAISTDTRTITKGSVFVALKGDNFDGHNYAQKAIELGAVAAITEKPIEGVKCIIVDDTRNALIRIATYYRKKFSLSLVGITGSVGKTTTKEMVALVLSGKYTTLKTEGNLNNDIGVPHTLFRLSSAHEAAVIEMGMSDLGEISLLSQISQPNICVITNIGYSHIETLGSREGILKAKLEIIDGASPDAPLILNGDDDLLSTLKDDLNRNIIYYGIDNTSADVRAVNIVSENGSTEFDIIYWSKEIHVKLGCVGLHNIMNALAAFAVGILCEIDPEVIVKKLGKFIPDGLRQSIVKKGEQTIIVDCYNASPDSMKASLAVLSELKPIGDGRRIAVLGDMLELGDVSKELHSRVGKYASDSKADIIVCYGKDAEYIKKEAESKKPESYFFEDRKDVLDFLKKTKKQGDIILFKASRGMKFEKIIEELYK